MLEDALVPDDKLIYVSPENLYYCYANDTIDQDDKWTSIQPQQGYIPILSANLRAYKIELLKNSDSVVKITFHLQLRKRRKIWNQMKR